MTASELDNAVRAIVRWNRTAEVTMFRFVLRDDAFALLSHAEIVQWQFARGALLAAVSRVIWDPEQVHDDATWLRALDRLLASRLYVARQQAVTYSDERRRILIDSMGSEALAAERGPFVYHARQYDAALRELFTRLPTHTDAYAALRGIGVQCKELPDGYIQVTDKRATAVLGAAT